MARSNFGGKVEQLVVKTNTQSGDLKATPNAVLDPLYDGPKSDGGRAIVNDFLIDPEYDGTYSASTTVPTDDDGYAVPFQGPDGVTILYDFDGRAFYSNDPEGSLPLGDTTLAGIWEGADLTEALGTATNRVITPAGLDAKMDAHENDPTSHQDLRDQVADNFTALTSKADLVGGAVPDSQIASSTSATADLLARRTSTGALAVATGLADDEAVNRLQMETALNDSASVGADVRQRSLTGGTLSVPTPAGTFVDVPGITITDGASGQIWQCEYTLHYRALAAAGIQVRFKANTSAVTNKLANPSFETNTTNWTPTAATALARASAVAASDGTFYMTMTAVTATNSIATSEWVPATPGSVWTAGAQWKWQTGTPKVCRTDIQFGDATQTAIAGAGTVLGSGTTPTTGAWSQSVAGGAGGATAPTGTEWVRVRLAVTGPPAVNDVARVDAVQLEPSAPLPAYGSTGGGGTTALEVSGYWRGLTNGATDNTTQSKVEPVRTPTVSGTTGQFGGVDMSTDSIIVGSFEIAVVGTGLTNQIIQPQVSQRVSNATAAQIVAARATFARTT